jgi:hypothetical protein
MHTHSFPTLPAPLPQCAIFCGTSFLLLRQALCAAANLTTNELLLRGRCARAAVVRPFVPCLSTKQPFQTMLVPVQCVWDVYPFLCIVFNLYTRSASCVCCRYGYLQAADRSFRNPFDEGPLANCATVGGRLCVAVKPGTMGLRQAALPAGDVATGSAGGGNDGCRGCVGCPGGVLLQERCPLCPLPPCMLPFV